MAKPMTTRATADEAELSPESWAIRCGQKNDLCVLFVRRSNQDVRVKLRPFRGVVISSVSVWLLCARAVSRNVTCEERQKKERHGSWTACVGLIFGANLRYFPSYSLISGNIVVVLVP